MIPLEHCSHVECRGGPKYLSESNCSVLTIAAITIIIITRHEIVIN